MLHAKPLTRIFLFILFFSFPTLSAPVPATEPDKSETLNGFTLKATLFSAASHTTSSGSYLSHGTLGESLVGSVGGSSTWEMHAGIWSIFYQSVLNVSSALPQPFENYLIQNFPNPFNPATTIRYAVASESLVSLAVFSLKGELVCQLVSEVQPTGNYEVLWNGRDDRGSEVASGLYFCRLRIGDFTSVNKMMLLK